MNLLWPSNSLLRLLGSLLSIGLWVSASAAALEASSISREQTALETLKLELQKSYAEVRHLSIETFRSSPAPKLLLDVRSAEEYRVSRIPGAIWIADNDQLLRFAEDHGERLLVLYCSVGARSSQAARRLIKAGHVQVANLAGSIFEWSNSGYPLENGSGATTEVHPYNAFWGWRYLDDEATTQR
jgi:rhodanese-related sulfurtransferase